MDHDERRQAGLDRRRFLGGAAGAVALGAAGLAGCGPRNDGRASESPWDHEADVVVIGSGPSGASAAAQLAARGVERLLRLL